MERLTMRNELGEAITNPHIRKNGHTRCLEKLAHYEDLEEQGRLIYLPCKVGTPVYTVAEDCGGDIFDCMRGEYGECEDCDYLYSFVEQNAFDTYMVNEVGKTIFLTKEEAEKKLADMQEG